MEKIGAWIRDPKNNLFKGMSKRAALYQLYCESPAECDLLQKENTCLHCGAMTYCKFGRKNGTEGPTRQAQSFGSTLSRWRKDNEGFLNKLDSLRAYNRIFRVKDEFYLPYSFMAKTGLVSDCPLESEWIKDADLTTELLNKICTARPCGMGGVIPDYQGKQVPKFIADLNQHYPEVFERLPDDQKARLATVNYKGRRAALKTCRPSKYKIGTSVWEWNGSVLRGSSMLFQPVPGSIEIVITPNDDAAVEISDNTQVGPETRFLD